MMRFRLVWFMAMSVLIAGFAAAAAWSVRLGLADYWFQQETIMGTVKAIALTPDQAACYVRLALLSDDDPARATEALKRAVVLNPSDARSWIELGLRFEVNGENGMAEKCMLRAAEVDKKYLPRWTLANYYFRRNDIARFWFWAKAAAEMIYGDPLPMFRLCARITEDGNLIDRLDIRKTDVRASYLSYLLGQGRIDLIARSSRQLLDANRESDVRLLLTSCDRLLDGDRVDEALGIWNRLARAHRIPFLAAAESAITNGNFAVAPTSLGFDWRLPSVDGISAAREENDGGLRLTFSGRQPEQCESLAQFVPVRENTPYELRFRYRTSGVTAGTGLGWRITDSSGARMLTEPEGLSSDSEAKARLSFATPAGCRLVRLALVYRRVPGTTRIEGFIVLRQIALKPVVQLPSEGLLRSRVMK